MKQYQISPRAQASSGLRLRPNLPDAEDDEGVDEAQAAWRAWMKVSIAVPEGHGMSCDVLDWWKVNAVRFPLIAKAAQIVLATASEAICERLFKRAKHIGTTDRMARLMDETFERLVMAQYNIARHGGVEAIEVSIFCMNILMSWCLLTLPWQGSGTFSCVSRAWSSTDVGSARASPAGAAGPV